VDLPLFDQVGDLVRAMTPEDLGALKLRSHRRGLKVWFDTEKPPREHYEAQVLARRHVDGRDGLALEVGFHAENRDEAENQQAIDTLMATEKKWRKELGAEAEVAPFYGADQWRRISEAWIEPDLEDPELAFELASRMVDYLIALEPRR
jgi:hypothetical protein